MTSLRYCTNRNQDGEIEKKMQKLAILYGSLSAMF